jgi:hypothetical protein
MSPEIRIILSILAAIAIIVFMFSLMKNNPDPFEEIKKDKDEQD